MSGPPLSPREREVADLIAAGLTDRAIAQRLFVSGRTAEGYVRQILNKLGLDNRAQIASWATGARLGAAGSIEEPRPTPVPNNLPMQVTTFIGREHELAETRRLLERARVLTISGPAGSGKTRLAIQAASEMLRRCPNGVWFVDLSAVTDSNVVPRAIASALGVAERGSADALDAVASALAGARHRRGSLIVLDNCEHLVDRCATTVATLLQASPHLAFLCTSREPLHIPGEAVWRLDPLPLPPVATSLMNVVRQADAVRLFLDRLSLSCPTFELNEANTADVLHLCQRLDGIPLALELAAARVCLMPFDQVQRHLESRVSRARMRGVPSRQQTLTATLDWSYDLLDDAERWLLRRLGVFAGGFTEQAVAAVCSEPSGLEPNVPDLLAQLVDKSLVLPVPPRTARYRCLEIIRRYSLDRLAESGEVGSVRRRHLDYFLDLAESAAPALTGPEQSAWLERLADDHDNLRAALEESRSDVIDRRLRLVLALDRFWTVRGHLGEGRQWMEEVLSSAHATEATPLQAMVCNAAGGLAFQQGDLPGARAHLEASLALWGELGERLRIQPCLNNLGLIAAGQRDWEAARAWATESLSLARELGDDRATALALGNLGVVLATVGEHGAAQASLDEALELTRRLDDSIRVAMALANLGTLAVRRDRAGEAAGRYRESLEILRSLRARSNLAECIEGFAWLAARAGRPERALRLAGAAATIRSEVGTPRPATSSPLVEGWIGEARAVVRDSEAAWKDGSLLSDEQAISLALDEPDWQRSE